MSPQFGSEGLLDRRPAHRDARLFVIAVEGAAVGEECQYFDRLEALDIIDRMRVKILPLPVDPKTNLSAPTYVLERLTNHCARTKMREEFDRQWVVLDVDAWTSSMLSEVTQKARQCGYGVAISNPCFELWLILHETDDLDFLTDIPLPKRSGATKQRLKELRGHGCAILTVASLEAAIARALRLDGDDSTTRRWPQQSGSHVYKLIEDLGAMGVLKHVRHRPLESSQPPQG